MSEELQEYRDRLKASLKVPEGYFSESKKQLLNIPKERNPSERNRIYPKRQLWFYAAAVLMLGTFLYFFPSGDQPEELPLAELSEEFLTEYLSQESYSYAAEWWATEDAAMVEIAEGDLLETIPDDPIRDFLWNTTMEETLLYTDYED